MVELFRGGSKGTDSLDTCFLGAKEAGLEVGPALPRCVL